MGRRKRKHQLSDERQRELEDVCPGLSAVLIFMTACVTRGGEQYGTVLKLARENYRAYLQSEHWILTKQIALVIYGARCAVCGSGFSLDVHHRSYEFIGRERLIDLVVLCRKCHKIVHRFRERHDEVPYGAFASKKWPDAYDVLYQTAMRRITG